MGDDTEVLIQIDSTGGDEAASDLNKVVEATDQITESNVQLSSQLGKGLETGGMHLFSHEMMQAVGIGGQMRALFPLVTLATRELDGALLAMGGTFATVTFGASALVAGLIYLIETHKKHKEAVEDVDNAIKKYLEDTDPVIIAHRALEAATLEETKSLEVQKKAATEHLASLRAMSTEMQDHSTPSSIAESGATRNLAGDILYTSAQVKQLTRDYEDHRNKLQELIEKQKEEQSSQDDFMADVKKLAEQETRAIMANIEGKRKETEEFKKNWGDEVQLADNSMKLIGQATALTAEGSVTAWKQAGEKILVDLADMLEKKLDMMAMASFAEGHFAMGAMELAGVGAIEGVKTLIGSTGTMSAPTGSTPIAVSNIGSSASTGVGSTATTGVSSPSVTINAGMMFMPDQASFMSALQQFWLQSGIAMNSGIIPKYQLA